MARMIRRRRRVSHPGPVRPVENVRSQTSLPEARPMPATRVVIAAPGPLRTVLTSRISGSTEVKLAGFAENEVSTIEKIITEEADVVAIYIHLGGELAGLDIARSVSKSCPEAGVLVIVGDLAGVDLRRRARMFGVAWSYALAKNAETGHNFTEMVQSVARGIHWIDPSIKHVLEAIWKVASEGRDLDISDAVGRLEMSTPNAPRPSPAPGPATPPSTGGIQTMRAGNSGIGHGGFGVSKAG
ncbi:MAG: hypothetical protein O3B04_01120 [Chloroflexi bacterium]|nr:hypothetical protein [Chloroflexota bacterium]